MNFSEAQPHECGLKHVQQSFSYIYEIIQQTLKGYRCIANTYELFRCWTEKANHINMVGKMFNKLLDCIYRYIQEAKNFLRKTKRI